MIDTSGLEDSEITYRKIADISGVVVDTATQEPVFAAEVRVENEQQVTDASGAFFISGVKAGDQMVTVSHPDYKAYSKIVTLVPGSNAVGALQLISKACVPDCTSCGVSDGCGGTCSCPALTITSTTPSEGATNVGLADAVVINFNAAVDRGSGTIEVTPTVTGISATLVSTTQLRVVHDEFAAGAAYEVKLSGFTSQGRQPLAPYLLRFSTSTCRPVCAPSLTACGADNGCGGTCPCQQLSVQSMQPLDNATGVGPNTPFVITFSAPVQRSSCVFRSFPEVAGLQMLWANDSQASIGHDPLAAATAYTLTLSGCASPGLLPLAETVSHLTTAASGTTLVVTATNPTSGAVKVPKTSPIEISFSAEVSNPTAGTITVSPELSDLSFTWSNGNTKLSLGHAPLTEYETYVVSVSGFAGTGVAPMGQYAIVFTTGGCVPHCAGRDCGSDGCGGTCGSCDAPPADSCTDDTRVHYMGGGVCTAAGVCDFSTARNEENCAAESKVCVGGQCQTDVCSSVTCSGLGVCTIEAGEAVCNCNDGYKAVGMTCVVNDTTVDNCWIQWYGGPSDDRTIDVDAGASGPSTRIYTQFYEPGITTVATPGTMVRGQLGYMKGAPSYPVIASAYTWVDAAFNSTCTTCAATNHEYEVDFPTTQAGKFNFITRFSLDGGSTWRYCQGFRVGKVIDANPVDYGKATVRDPALCSVSCDAWAGCGAQGSCEPRERRCAVEADCAEAARKKCDVAAHRCVDPMFGTPTFDGVVNEASGDWTPLQLVGSSSTASSWGSINVLSKIYVAYDNTYLYIGVVGSVPAICGPESNNAIVVLLDTDYGGPNGRTDLNPGYYNGTYCAADLDEAITRPYTISDSMFKPDWAVGSCRMMDSYDESGGHNYSGWRYIGAPGSPFVESNTGRQLIAGSASFEARIGIDEARIGIGGMKENMAMAVVGRLGRTEGDELSNQTVPTDNPGNPLSIGKVGAFLYKPY